MSANIAIQRDELIEYVRQSLDEELEEFDTESDGYSSDLDFYCAVWGSLKSYFEEKGISGFFSKGDPKSGYPSLEQYDEDGVREIGQLIGDVIIELNPIEYRAETLDAPMIDLAARYHDYPFAFKPLPILEKWEIIDPSDAPNVPAIAKRARRFKLSDEITFLLWSADSNDLALSRGIKSPRKSSREVWVGQICVPTEEISMYDTTCPNWFRFQYLLSEARQLPEINEHDYVFVPLADEYQAWCRLADVWQGFASRFL